MPKIIWEGSPTGEWDPIHDELLLPKLPKYREKAHIILGHELAHRENIPPGSWESPMGTFVAERDAWKETIRKLLPEEIDLDFVNTCLGGYLKEVREYYGEDSPQARECGRMRSELMRYARGKKGD